MRMPRPTKNDEGQTITPEKGPQLREFRDHLPDYIAQAEHHGREIVLYRYKKAVAKLVPLNTRKYCYQPETAESFSYPIPGDQQ